MVDNTPVMALPWADIIRYIDSRIQSEQQTMVSARSTEDLLRSQGRLSVWLEMQRLPEALQTMEVQHGEPDARSPRRLWPKWALQPGERG